MTDIVCDSRLRRAFDTFDHAGKGFITLDELERLLRAFGLADVSKQLVASFMRSTVSGTYRINEVTFEDARKIIQSNYTSGSTEEMWTVFKLIDDLKRKKSDDDVHDVDAPTLPGNRRNTADALHHISTGRLTVDDLRAAAIRTGIFNAYIPTEGASEIAERRRRKVAARKRRQQQEEKREQQLREDRSRRGVAEDEELAMTLGDQTIKRTRFDITVNSDLSPSESAGLADDQSEMFVDHDQQAPPQSKTSRSFARFIELVAEYPDKGITFEEWRRIQVKMSEGDDRAGNFETLSQTFRSGGGPGGLHSARSFYSSM
jgi:hypothetical protein